MSQTIRIDLSHDKRPDTVVWVSLALSPSPEGMETHLDIDRATGYRGDLSPAVMQVLRSEIQAGILMALKQVGSRQWRIELERLGVEAGEAGLLDVPSDGFAVAATLAVLHGTGVEDLRVRPHGGYDWRFKAIDVV